MLRYARPWCSVTNMRPAISTLSPTGCGDEVHRLPDFEYSPLRTNWIPKPEIRTNVVLHCQKSDFLEFEVGLFSSAAA